MFKGKTRTKNF